MIITNHNKQKLKFGVTGYFKDKTDETDFTNDWLTAELSIYGSAETLMYSFEFLLIEELELLKDWFENLLFSLDTKKRYYFLDTPVILLAFQRAGKKLLKFYVKKEETITHYDLILNCDILYKLIHNIQLEISKYPCRCNLSHDIFSRIKHHEIDIILKNQAPIEKLNLKTRDFRMPYQNYKEMLAGNLYLWLGQNLDIMYHTNIELKQLIIYKTSVKKLSERFSTLEKIGKEKSHRWLLALIFEIAQMELFFQKKLRNFNQEELEKLNLILKNNEMLAYYQRFKKMFIKTKKDGK
jgi:hypothetical protein